MKTRKTTLWLLTGVVLICSCVFFYQSQQEPNSALLPKPTSFFESEEDERGEEERERIEFKKYLDTIHRAAPGVDWRKADQGLRDQKYAEWKRRGVARTSQTQEVLANGNLIGTWVERGSLNQAGRIVAVDWYSATSQLYAGAQGGQVWRGTAAGTGWTSLNDKIKFSDIIMLRAIPNGGGKRLLLADGGNKFYYSDDEGTSWTVSSGMNNVQSWGGLLRAVVMNDAARTVYVLLQEWDYSAAWEPIVSLYRSTDKGVNFSKVISYSANTYGGADRFDIWGSYSANINAYMLINNNVYYLNPANGMPVYISTFTLSSAQGRTLLCGTQNGANVNLYAYVNGYVYRSTNSGTTWAMRSYINKNPFSRTSFNCSINSPNNVFLGDIECNYSTDGGANWTITNGWGSYYGAVATQLHADVPCIAPMVDASNTEKTFIGTDGGLFVSNDGAVTVSNLSLSGLDVSQYYSVYTNRNNTNYIYAGAQDQGFQRTSSDPGGILNFNQVISGDYGHIVSGDNGNTIWLNYPGFTNYYANASTGGYSGWYNFPTNSTQLWLPPLMADPTTPTAAYLAGGHLGSGGSRLLRLTYSAGNITATEGSYDFSVSSGGGYISAMGYSTVNTAYRYVLTNNGKFFYSTNSGASWTMSGVTGPGNHYFYGSDMFVSKTNLGTIYIAGSGYSNPGVYRSTDNGATFTAISTGLPSTMVFQLAAIADESLIFAATEVGPYAYVVSENKWYDISGTGAPNQTYWSVEYLAATKTIRYATYGRGIWDFNINNPTPVTLSNLTAERNDNNVRVKWTTYTELNNKGFEIQRSYDGFQYNTIGFVPGLGNSSAAHDYEYLDASSQQGVTVYYRLKQIDLNGVFTYSNWVSVAPGSGLKRYITALYPMPFQQEFNVTFNEPLFGDITLSIVDMKGVEVWKESRSLPVSASELLVRPNTSLTNGVYVFIVQCGNYKERQVVVKQ